MIVTIKTIKEDEISYLEFNFVLEFGIKFSFKVDEPYLCTFEEWEKLANGNGTVSLYQGNGEGSIESKNDEMIFVAAPSGSGGDVTSTFTIPLAHVSSELKRVLDEVKKEGWFDEKNY